MHIADNKKALEDCLYVTKRLFDENFAERPFVLLQKQVRNRVDILKPKIEAIVDNAILVSTDIYEMYGNKQLEVCNDACNTRISLPIIQYKHCGDKQNTIWLSSHQRQLMGLELPMHMNELNFSQLLSCLKNSNERELFNKIYQKNNETQMYELNDKLGKRDKNEASKWYRLRYATVSINHLDKYEENIVEKGLRKLIGTKKIVLKVVKSPDLDDASNIIRLSQNNIKMLGVEETDYVDIYYANKKAKLRVVEIDDVFKDIIIKDNQIHNPNELEFIVSMPIKYRHQLDVNDIKKCVVLERNTKFIFFKNANIQMLTIFGLIMTVFGLPIESLTYQILLIIILIPLTLLSAFSFERQKIAS